MECHGMSCFVMIRMRVAHSLLSLRACSRRFGPGLGVFRPIFPALRLRHGSLLSIPLRSVHPVAGSPAAAGPFFARIARGRGRPLAPARFARLIAPARASPSSGRTSPVSFSGVFSRRREPGKEAAPRGYRFLPRVPISGRISRSQGIFELFHKLRTNGRCRRTGSRSGAISNRSLSRLSLPPAAPRRKR